MAPAAVLRATRSPRAGPAILGAVGELIADKLPATPSRLGAAPLAFRVVSGGWSAVTLSAGNRTVGPWLLGALGATVGANAGYWLRRKLARSFAIPDFPLALAEDAIALSIAYAVTRASTAPPHVDEVG